jgi:hypothetical protein
MKKIIVISLITFWIINDSVCSWSSITSPLRSVLFNLHLYPESSSKPTSSEIECSGCAKNLVAQMEQDSILTELRVEYVKQQILRKLRLEKPPEVSISLSTLPKPLINGHILELKPGEPLEPQIPAESFYGKTNQIVVFPNEGQEIH